MRILTSLLLAIVAIAGSLAAQNASDLIVAEYQKRRDEEMTATGKRHLDLGLLMRDSGMVAQATWQLVRAVELTEGKHPGASTVLGLVRGYGEAFWKKRKTPSQKALKDYETKAAGLEADDRKGQVKLAKLALKAKLNGRMTEHWLAALRLGAKVEVAAGAGRIDGEAVPAEFAAWLQQQTSQVNGGQARFEPAGDKAPRVAGVREVANAQVVVRTDLPGDAAAELHALALAEWPLLQERLGGTPVRPLGLFVFGKRADYEEYLKACGHAGALGGSGLCDYGTFQTLVCADGLAAEDMHALVLHELAHLFFFGSAPVAMPDWYAEGFAESFGGQGTFQWDGKKLTLGGTMRRDRIEAMSKEPMPLRDLFAAKADELLLTDHARGLRFYAQCWALQRWFLQADNPWRERFLAWEAECRGALPGVVTTVRFGDGAPATAAFERQFGKELAAIESSFRDWLSRQ